MLPPKKTQPPKKSPQQPVQAGAGRLTARKNKSETQLTNIRRQRLEQTIRGTTLLNTLGVEEDDPCRDQILCEKGQRFMAALRPQATASRLVRLLAGAFYKFLGAGVGLWGAGLCRGVPVVRRQHSPYHNVGYTPVHVTVSGRAPRVCAGPSMTDGLRCATTSMVRIPRNCVVTAPMIHETQGWHVGHVPFLRLVDHLASRGLSLL